MFLNFDFCFCNHTNMFVINDVMNAYHMCKFSIIPFYLHYLDVQITPLFFTATLNK